MLDAVTLPRRRASRTVKISLTPLIDVVFILLVFFMLASSFLDWRSIRLSAAAETPAAQPSLGGVEGALLVDVGPSHVRLSGSVMSLEALGAAVAGRIAAKPTQKLVIRLAKGAPMQRLVLVLDRLGAAGAEDIALMPGAQP